MIVLVLIVFGLCLGSFVNALVWRINIKETAGKKKIPRAQSVLYGRSMCVHCKHNLAAKDLIPVISWLCLRGKCRYCRKTISWQYPAVELITAILFVFSYIFWPSTLTGVAIVTLVAWLLTLVVFMALSVYDVRWFILPDRLIAVVTVIVSVNLLLQDLILDFSPRQLVAPALGGLVLFSFFWMLFQASQGKWIGGGDVKLAVALGLLGGSPLNAFLIIFIASLVGCLVALVLLPFRHLKLHSKLPFGPMLMFATVIVYLFGASLVTWYKRQIGII